MINTEKLCLGCMNDNGGEKNCPICGFDSSTQNPQGCLPTKFFIKNRYYVGKVTDINGESITYIGWDNSNDLIVNIKEYFPIGFAHRNPDLTVTMEKGKEYTFNEGLLEFKEIKSSIMRSELPTLMPVSDVFEENSTVYAIQPYITGITLGEFLNKNGGTLKWEQARALFLPLIDTLKGMNDIGIIHRGISDETIIVCRDGKLRISDYSIKKLRLANSELKTQLYHGFAAIEQYGFENMHDDTYTDVYGICATLFKVLIGSAPPVSSKRIQNDSMTIPAKFAEELPRHVLAALANGLQVLPEDRTKDIETFKNELVYGEIASLTDSKQKTGSTESKEKKNPQRKGITAKYVMISSACTALVFIVVATILIFGVFKEYFFGSEISDISSIDSETSAPIVDQVGDVESGAELASKLYVVPDLIGKYYAKVIEEEEYEMFNIVISAKNFSKEPRGTICFQSITPDSPGVVKGTEISVTISLGPKEIKMPNLKGMDLDTAKMELLKAGFLYENIDDSYKKYDATYDPGEVTDQEPKSDTEVSPDIGVKIYINPDVDEELEQTTTSNKEANTQSE